MSNNPAGGNLGYVDSFSLSEITVNQKLWLADNGLNVSNLVANYSSVLKTAGRSQNATTSGSYTFIWFPLLMYRKMKLAAVLWDCRSAATYTCTLRDFEDNVLVTTAVVLAEATENAVFSMGNYEMLPGRYKIRMTRSAAGTWWVFDTTVLLVRSEYAETAFPIADTTQFTSLVCPAKLRWRDELP